MIRRYVSLTKPGIIRGNLLTAVAGFMLASQGHVSIGGLLATLTGLALVIASGCVLNNIIDRDIDSRMERTSKRALVTHEVGVGQAALFAALLLLAGLLLLGMHVNVLTSVVALFGHFAYVVLYTFSKRKTVLGTLIGSISGAVPPVVGYTAVTGQIDLAAILLFLILVAWQMPHFYAIALFRKKEYQSAHIPVLPIVRGNDATIRQIIAYIVAFILLVPILTVAGYSGIIYAISMISIGIWWLIFALRGLRIPKNDQAQWAKKVFLRSILILPLFAVVVSIDSFI